MINLSSRSVDWSGGGGVCGLDLLLGVDSLSFVLDIGDVPVLIDGVANNLGAGVGKSNPVRSGSLVAVPAFDVTEVVGVRVVDGVLEVVLGSGVGVHLHGSGGVSGSGGVGRRLGPGSGNGQEGGEGNDLG
jgi:hypothetical protein